MGSPAFLIVFGFLIASVIFIIFAGKNQQHIAAARKWLLSTATFVWSKIVSGYQWIKGKVF
jgi:hypothetical protein